MDRKRAQRAFKTQSVSARATVKRACTMGQLDVITRYVQEGKVKLNDPDDSDNGTFLHIACANENYVVAEHLINLGADLNARDIIGDTPLYDAIFTQNIELVKLLLDRGALVDPPYIDNDCFQYSPLAQAANDGLREIVALLLERGANVKRRPVSKFDICSSLVCGAGSGNATIVEMLLNAGADVNERDFTNQTPLMKACQSDRASIVRLLLARGADVHAESLPLLSYGRHTATPLSCSFVCCRLTLTNRQLIAAGADIQESNNHGETFLSRFSKNSDESSRKDAMALYQLVAQRLAAIPSIE